MSNGHERDGALGAFLWDPTERAHPDVEAVTQRLSPMRFDPARRPLPLPRRPDRRRLALYPLAAAAALALAVYGYVQWREQWPAGQPWPVAVQASSGTASAAELTVGQPLEVAASTDATVAVARIGTMRVAGGAELTLQSTSAGHHRVFLSRGAVSVRLWAPPWSFVVRTPAGEVGDLGCQFDASVDAEGVTRVTVRSGWVKVENVLGESLVPAGASALMRPGVTPFVAVYDDADAEFREGVRAYEAAPPETAGSRLAGALAHARPRDVLTLLVLATRTSGATERDLVQTALRLSPPPASIHREAVLAGDASEIWQWADTLPLPPPKSSWWRNWPDALPAWLSGLR
jgi:FecR protein